MKEDTPNPVVSVVMPVYNGERYIRETIDSILTQTFRDFEFLIVNDGSTDKSVEIIKSYKDKRITLIDNKKNKGWVLSVNDGLMKAKGRYVACLQADDLSHPKRISLQAKYLDNHPEIFLVGTSAIFIDEKGVAISKFRKYNNPYILAWRLRKSCSIIYSSIMFRNEQIFLENKFGPAADYHFYYKLLKEGKKLTNLPGFLTKYRVHSGNMSIQKKSEQERARDEAIKCFKQIPDKTNLFKKIYYSLILAFHYIRTINEKRLYRKR